MGVVRQQRNILIKMASFLSHASRFSAHVGLFTKFHGIRNVDSVLFLFSRNVYGDSYLNMDKYLEQRERTAAQFNNMKEKFTSRMKQYIDSDTQGVVFSDDLRHMIHLAENKPEDIDLVFQMLKKFRNPTHELRFDTFAFGPVVMRLFHYLNLPDHALKMLHDPDLVGFFDQVSSYTIAMNLLYKQGQYDKVVELYDSFRKREFSGRNFPKDIIVLLIAAYYKINTKEALRNVVGILQEAQKAAAFILRKAITFAAALAVKQNSPAQALEILGLTHQQNYFTVKNLKILALVELNRLEDVLMMMQTSLQRDIPDTAVEQAQYCEEVVSLVKDAFEKLQNKEQLLLFQRVEMALRERRMIAKTTIEESVCSPILTRPPPKKDTRITGFESRFFLPAQNRSSVSYGRRQQATAFHRKGLTEYDD